ncbi:MAG: tetratricopeptide repeat protein [Burkholderiales bacterium]|jgi:hypothetical protein|nr:tetratricopeptide repeat protein [Burkholderiales bacterium]
MKFPRFLLLCLGLLAALWMGAAQAEPTVKDVQAATQRGDYAEAEKLVREVIAAKPDSARAQYVLAEILAHERQFNEAAEHVRRARAIDPAIKFADPVKFSAFEQLLQREQAAAAKSTAVPAVVSAAPPQRAAPAESSSGGGVPVWLLIAGVVIFIWLAMRWMRSRTAVQTQPAMAGGYGPGGYGPGGYGVPQQPSSGGPGLMGVGLGVAGGVAAGMLAEKLLHEGHDDRSIPRDRDVGGNGLIPGSFDNGGNSAADELSRRDVDFGNGDGWGGGDAGGGDFGGGGGGSDDW